METSPFTTGSTTRVIYRRTETSGVPRASKTLHLSGSGTPMQSPVFCPGGREDDSTKRDSE